MVPVTVKMQSLRSRKSESQTKVQRSPSKLIRQNGRSTTRVDEKMKRRMSMRYAEISSPTDALVPAVPALPIGLQPISPSGIIHEGIPEVETPREDPRLAELRLLDKDDFDPDAYLKQKMANSTEAQLKTMQSSLRSQRDGVAKDLQQDVFRNYAEFVQISKEVSVIENEMLEFKDCLAEWKNMPSLLHIEESSSAAERRRNVRSSIADLRVLYANQMQTLHTQIEGSSKYVPTTPGRHVVAEMDGILALNAATYKVDHTVRFVVLDDAVLVARIRRRRNNAESDKLVAERCWPLNEMLVLDTKDTATMSNVFKIRHGKETLVYRTEASADKKHLLSQFRQVAEELSAKRRKEREVEHLGRKSIWGGDRGSMAFSGDAVPPVPTWMAELVGQTEMGSTAKEKAERDGRWISDFCDELTVAIALREWDRAVGLVEQGEAQLPKMPALGTKLTPLKASLTSLLLQSLSSPSNRKSAVTTLIALLVRLKASAAARNTFLTAREELMRRRVRMIRFEGHVGVYVGDLAVVYFTGIKHTADWYLSSFKENEVASFFIEWAKKQVELYAELFRKQVYSSDVDKQTVEDAIKITHMQSKKSLEEYGIDFRFLIDKLLSEQKEPSGARRLPVRHYEKSSDLLTPANTPIRVRSPAAPVCPEPSPVPPVPPLPAITTTTSSPTTPGIPAARSTPSPVSPTLRSPTPRSPASRTASPAPRSARSPTPTPANASLDGMLHAAQMPFVNPAPPPRSKERPGSAAGHRPPPVAVPKREGMF